MQQALVGGPNSELSAADISVVAADESAERWIARELHDVVAQCLTTVLIELQILHDELPVALSNRLVPLEDEVRVGLNGVRDLIYLLRGEPVEEQGFTEIVERLLEDLHRKTQIKTCLHVSPEWPSHLPVDVALNLRRIVQEALTNVRLHSGASHLDVFLHVEGGCVSVLIADNGAGIVDLGSVNLAGKGIVGMRERAFLLGGRLLIEAAPGKGTVVRVSLGRVRASLGGEP
jgi:two-component system sensor histidine kinase UhpB